MQESSKKPRQERSVKTEQALLDALEALLEQMPFNEITVAKVAAEAGVTTGAIYRRFKDKEDVLHGAFRRFLERTRADAERRYASAPGMGDREILDVAVSRTIDFTLANTPLMRAASQLNDHASFELLLTARNSAADDVAARLKRSVIDEAEFRARVRFILRMVTAVARDTFLAGPAARLPGVRFEDYRSSHQAQLANLRQRLLDIACAYIGVSLEAT